MRRRGKELAKHSNLNNMFYNSYYDHMATGMNIMGSLNKGEYTYVPRAGPIDSVFKRSRSAVGSQYGDSANFNRKATRNIERPRMGDVLTYVSKASITSKNRLARRQNTSSIFQQTLDSKPQRFNEELDTYGISMKKPGILLSQKNLKNLEKSSSALKATRTSEKSYATVNSRF